MENKVHILLLEDVVSDSELVERELSKAKISYTGKRVDTRQDFVEALLEFQPHIILADYSLPQFGAMDALRLLKETNVDIPLILVTGSHSEEVAVECMKEGADDYILKASLTRLPSAIKNTLKKRDAERKKEASETAFHRSEEQYRLITENTRDLICLLDLQFKFIYASPSYRLVLGLEPKNLVGTDGLELIHPDDLAAFKAALDDALFFRDSRTAELRFRHIETPWIFESAVSFIFDEDGKPKRVLVVSRDTSDRKRAEMEIRKLAAFPRFNPNPVLEFAADGTLTYFNEAALEMAH